jgi:flagellum-specific ATP synthase
VNVLDSISRVADDVTDVHQQQARKQIIRLLAAYSEAEELINIGAYARGSNLVCDAAIAMKDEIDAFLQQNRLDKTAYPLTCRQVIELAATAERLLAQRIQQARPSSPMPATSTTASSQRRV